MIEVKSSRSKRNILTKDALFHHPIIIYTEVDDRTVNVSIRYPSGVERIGTIATFQEKVAPGVWDARHILCFEPFSCGTRLLLSWRGCWDGGDKGRGMLNDALQEWGLPVYGFGKEVTP